MDESIYNIITWRIFNMHWFYGIISNLFLFKNKMLTFSSLSMGSTISFLSNCGLKRNIHGQAIFIQ
jgi:hypothetical protein